MPIDRSKIILALVAILSAAASLCQINQLLASTSLLFAIDDNERRKKRKHQAELMALMPYMRNLFSYHGSPERPLDFNNRIDSLFSDTNSSRYFIR